MTATLLRAVGLREGQRLPAWARFRRTRTYQQRLSSTVKETLYVRDAHLCLVSRQLADEMRVWSAPVQFMAEPRDDGLIELVCRRVEEEATA